MFNNKLMLVSALTVSLSMAQVEDKQVLTHEFDVRGELDVENDVGNVTVTGSDVHNKITVEVVKRANTKEELEQFNLKFDVHDKATKAKVKSNNVKRVKNAQIDLNIIVPRYTEADVDVGVGDAVVQNLKGQMKVEAKSGSISISGARKEVEARAGTGDVKVTYAAEGFGKADVKVANGGITVVNAGGSVDAKTGNGDISIDQRVLPHKEDIDAKTDAGSVSVSLPSDVNATVKAETKAGDIQDGGLKWMRKKAKEDRPKPVGDEARIVLGKGYADVDLLTKSGSVSVQLK